MHARISHPRTRAIFEGPRAARAPTARQAAPVCLPADFAAGRNVTISGPATDAMCSPSVADPSHTPLYIHVYVYICSVYVLAPSP